jgi:hypothetical protein
MSGVLLERDGLARALVDRCDDSGAERFVGMLLEQDQFVVVGQLEDLGSHAHAQAVGLAPLQIDDDTHGFPSDADDEPFRGRPNWPIHPSLRREDIVLPLSEKNVSTVPDGGTTEMTTEKDDR